MTRRKVASVDFALNDIPVFSILVNPDISGFTLGLKLKGRSVKVTYCINLDGLLDCHIKDNDEVVWQVTRTIEDTERRLKKEIKKGSFKWKPRQRILILDERMLEALGSIDVAAGKKTEFDLGHYLVSVAKIPRASRRVSRRIGEMMRDRPIAGFCKRFFRLWLVVVGPDGTGLRCPMSFDKGLLSEILPLRGIVAYFRYLDKQGLLDGFEARLDTPEGKEALENLEVALWELDTRANRRP